METTRQSKVARQIQKDISEIFIKELSSIFTGSLVTVTTVRVSPDLGYAKVYLSIFPFEKTEKMMEIINDNGWQIRKLLGIRMRNQLKQIPELSFFTDDSLEYIKNIDELLGDTDPATE